jgi:hypothetical protein
MRRDACVQTDTGWGSIVTGDSFFENRRRSRPGGSRVVSKSRTEGLRPAARRVGLSRAFAWAASRERSRCIMWVPDSGRFFACPPGILTGDVCLVFRA